ncbi:MAG: PPOX class F420-dependent oxidoreductase [Actinomycetota bacterium]|nr:PPOX class F420-dependent oxidoreductase [Actinomycetota bacterium]
MTSVSPPTLESVGRAKFVSLTSFRQDGTAVATAVWVAATPEGLVVTTPAGSHKVKRLRRRPEVTLQPCGRSGKVEPGAPSVSATVEIIEPSDTATTRDAVAALSSKYRLEYPVVMAIEKVMARFGRPSGAAGRVILRLTDPPT